MAKKQPKRWGYSPSSRASSPPVDAAAKAQVEAKVKEVIEKELKPKHIKPPPEDTERNYLTDIRLKWHGSTLFLVAVYACPGPNAIAPTFEDRFARLMPSAGGGFDLASMRHTGQWLPVFQGQTLDECLKSIRDDPWFIP